MYLLQVQLNKLEYQRQVSLLQLFNSLDLLQIIQSNQQIHRNFFCQIFK